MRREVPGVLMAVASALPALAWAGLATAEGQEQIARRLADRPECCVIDARGQLARMRAPVPFAVAFTSTVTVKKGAFALLVADSDAAALTAARAVARRSAGDVVAVNGGHATLAALGRTAPATATMPSRFNIPKNTCEQGEPLHEFKP
jgi:hypothetical protein